MPERTVEQIRKEISDEQVGLREDVAALKARLRSLLPFVIAGVAAIALAAVGLVVGIRKVRSR
jgi:hypothetical protein